MVQATDSLPTAHTTCNADPIRALADIWSSIHEIDRAQVNLRSAEEEAHQRKDCLEQAVIALEPQSADEALSVLLVAADELRHVQQADALQAVLTWLVGTGAQSPLLRVYRPRSSETLETFPNKSEFPARSEER